jgi:superfamily II DNA or RNA helicase
MPEVNPVELELALRRAFQRYLFSASGIAESESELRDAFWAALSKENVFAREALLSAMPSYELAEPVSDLFRRTAAPALHPTLAALNASAFDIERSLYSHQRTSIERIQSGRNVIVASGTGSGKTECFLLPILDDAVRNPGPGVRAIVVYPMNALANDQLHRLRTLLRDLPEITYGRYTGETPFDRTDMSPEDVEEIGGPNERATRQEIRAEPPHLLLTNFAMLEYLLLRPADADVFRFQRLRFVILDEAHSYQGAQGIDVGFLMRRLRQAHTGTTLQHVLTSATLGNDMSAVAAFGRALTGGTFDAADVIVGTRVHRLVEGGGHSIEHYRTAVPDNSALEEWTKALGDVRQLRSRLAAIGFPVPDNTDPSVGQLLFHALRANRDVARLHELLSKAPLTVAEVARRLWQRDDRDACRIVQWLAVLGANASESYQAPPLLPVRYHLFFKGLQAATVCLSSRCSGRADHQNAAWGHFMLEDRQQCELCESRVLPLLTCAHCGLPVLRVFQPNGQQVWNARGGLPNSSRAHLLTWRDVVREEDVEEPAEPDSPRARLCVSCGYFTLADDDAAASGSECGCDERDRRELFVLPATQEGHLQQCPNCRGQSRQFPSVLREFGTGEDAATAVLAETLIRALPFETEKKPSDGRRLLVFSDSRQRAAFFAPYLQRTTGETQVMAPLLAAVDGALRANPGGAPLDEIAYQFQKLAERQPFVIIRSALDDEGEEFGVSIKKTGTLLAADRSNLRRDCKVALLRHFTSQGRRRDTLPGLALAALAIDLSADAREEVAVLAQGLGLDEEGFFALAQHLMGSIVRRRAIQLPDEVTPRMLGPGPQQATMHRSDAGNVQGRTRIRWNSYRALMRLEHVVRRSPQVAAIATVLGVDPVAGREQIEPALERIWCWLRDHVLREVAPSEYVLACDNLTVVRPEVWSVCDGCGAITAWTVGSRCLMPGCKGALHTINGNDKARWSRNHQRARFTEAVPLPVQVREHTAQLTLQTGRSYQRKFMSGDVNVLSSSTTFEMGIDVGQLRATLLRNVPPTSANYIQRAGRAGRRQEGAAFAITYARAVPHDQTHFYAAHAIAGGTVAVPRIRIENVRLGQRHANSLLLGRFLAAAPRAASANTVSEFFVDPDPTNSLAASFSTWVLENEDVLRPAVCDILPPRFDSTAEAVLRKSCEMMAAVRADLGAELRAFDEREAQLSAVATAEDALRVARARKANSRLKQEYLTERLIDFLASEHWLPSYAFPQDVVKLRVVEPSWVGTFRLERDAEYGMAEYAPGAEVVADGKLLTSSAIDFKGRTADVRHYRICRHCHNVAIDFDRAAPPRTCPVCGTVPTGATAIPRPFLVPRGFSTSLDTPIGEVRLSRVKPARTSEVFLVSGVAPDSFVPHAELKGASVGYRPDGELFRANSGSDMRGFRVCIKCGSRVAKGNHRTPYGIACRGELKIVDLGYRFQTDTLQLRFDGLHPAPPPITDAGFWLSFQTALLGAASDVLKIPPRDLDGTYRAQDSAGARGEIVIYDRVPGGAGYVSRLQHELLTLLEATLRRVADCPNPQCDIEASCYACLRSYYNQFYWDQLKRRAVVQWLEPAMLGMGT